MFSPFARKLRSGRKIRPMTKLLDQFNDKPTDEMADTAWGGATSGMMTNRMGPNPKANDITKVVIAMLDKVTKPPFSP
ncbi:hypothetical protein CY34DRAFT_814004 [Suillus luteus UH-Slu-Lm8-n1]|uniref:Uncharacterized protein n=1 Tax=Suillus luteus UH-Slu-Lm8-n1 TaxID=930992 RepID=A0A0C9ZU73_9AGAM|nr:hypothetical protein CY34DRAFT_814004 [Suillus luteus UH-Slu-Lm8-n1]